MNTLTSPSAQTSLNDGDGAINLVLHPFFNFLPQRASYGSRGPPITGKYPRQSDDITCACNAARTKCVGKKSDFTLRGLGTPTKSQSNPIERSGHGPPTEKGSRRARPRRERSDSKVISEWCFQQKSLYSGQRRLPFESFNPNGANESSSVEFMKRTSLKGSLLPPGWS